MYLQKLEVQGFKSFAQRTTFLFSRGQGQSRGLTAIVGPNGSGKSNVADAIRWVLGEQSMKLLRSKKSEDVIFFGSDAKAQLGFCEVALSFNNEDRAFPVEYAEVVISRRLYRNGESEYLINNAKVRLADVIMLLAQGNCGQRSYSVIGQGMIDLLITMSPSERKHFFDEAAGVRAYQLKKEQAISKLKTTKEHIASARMLITELEPKIKFFERQRKRLEERQEVEQELESAYRQYYAASWHALKEQEASAKTSLDEIQGTLAAELSRHTLLAQEFQQHQDSSVLQGANDAARVRNEYDKLLRERTVVASRLSLIEARLVTEYEKTGEANFSFLLQRKGELDERKAEILSDQEKNRQDFQTASDRISKLTDELKNIEKSITELQTLLFVSTPAQADISFEAIAGALEALQQEKHYLFSPERTLPEIHEVLQRLFLKLDALRDTISHSLKGPSQETVHVKQALDTLLVRQRELLAHMQEERIAQGVQSHTTQQLARALETTIHECERIEQELTYFSSETKGEKNEQLKKEQQQIQDKLSTLDGSIAVRKQELNALYEEQSQSTSALLRVQRELAEAQKVIDVLRARETTVSLELAKGEAHQEELLKKMCEELGLGEEVQSRILSSHFDVSLAGLKSGGSSETPLSELRARAEQLKRKLDTIGAIDQEALSEYESTKERFEFLTQQAQDLTVSIDSLERGITELETNIQERFNHSFEEIEKKFCHYFQQLFNGGSARFVVVKSSDMESEEEADELEGVERQSSSSKADEIIGIDISAMPPGKKLKSMSVLSGGEKALTAIALICAIVSCNPSPFVVLDEVDAALDESNANRFASIIKELGEKTQFIVVTHNRATIHMAQCMYGVTMGEDGISRVLSLDIAKIDDTLASIKNDS